jgi:hypothetical protein
MIILFCFIQDEHRAFRRQLEDKRPVVESNLLSGRQYIANEPPLSDTSDSERKYYKLQRSIKYGSIIRAS